MRALIITAALVLLSACETMGSLQQASSQGLANMFTCDQIKATFAAYDRDRHSWRALKEIANMTGYDTSELDSDKPASYYEKVKNSANLALILKGCSPI